MKLSAFVTFYDLGFYSPVFHHVSFRQFSVAVHADIRVSFTKVFSRVLLL